MPQTTLGQRIAEARAMSGLSQSEWLRELGGNPDRPATASDWEKDKSVPEDVATLRKMLDLSGMDGHYLLTGQPPKKRTPEGRDTRAKAEGYTRMKARLLQVIGEVEGADQTVDAPMLTLELADQPEGAGKGKGKG